MKGERTAGPLHSARSAQSLSPCCAACPRTHPCDAPLFSSPLPTLSSVLPIPPPPLLHPTQPPPEGSSGRGRASPSYLSGPRPAGSTPLQRCLPTLLSCHLAAHSVPHRLVLSITIYFVAGMAAAITSDLPVSSIMDRLLDVNICKSLLLDSPPGRD